MSKNETLHIRVNDAVKLRAEKTLDLLGLSISEAVNMFLHQIPLVGGLPFDVKIPMAPESITIKNKNELFEKLNIGTKQIKEEKIIDANAVMTRIKDEYGFSR